jgi:hypothetical protein
MAKWKRSEAKRAYDTKYESTPERKKYRRDLARARRSAGLMGKGGPDMCHGKGGVKPCPRNHNRSTGGRKGGKR